MFTASNIACHIFGWPHEQSILKISFKMLCVEGHSETHTCDLAWSFGKERKIAFNACFREMSFWNSISTRRAKNQYFWEVGKWKAGDEWTRMTSQLFNSAKEICKKYLADLLQISFAKSSHALGWKLALRSLSKAFNAGGIFRYRRWTNNMSSGKRLVTIPEVGTLRKDIKKFFGISFGTGGKMITGRGNSETEPEITKTREARFLFDIASTLKPCTSVRRAKRRAKGIVKSKAKWNFEIELEQMFSHNWTFRLDFLRLLYLQNRRCCTQAVSMAKMHRNQWWTGRQLIYRSSFNHQVLID